MKLISKWLMRLIAIVMLLSIGGLGNAFAQDKASGPKVEAPKKGEPAIKSLVDNDKVKAYEATFKPGDVSSNRERKSRIVRYFTSGKLQRIYPDGKTEDRVFKAGDTIWIEGATYAVKNTTKSTVKLMVVEQKAK